MDLLKRVGCLSVFVTTFLLSTQLVSAEKPMPIDDVRQFDLHIEQYHLKGDLKKITVNQGQWVTLRWVSDESMDVHLHGYDIALSIVENVPAEMKFKALATGRFPIKSHGSGVKTGLGGKHLHDTLVYLEVYPN